MKGVGAIARSNAIHALGHDGRDPAVDAAYGESQKAVLQPRYSLKLAESLMNRTVITLLDTPTVQQAW